MADPIPDWARALGRVPSGLFIATAGVGDAATGFLASWVQQAGLEPPVVTVAVKGDRHVAELIRQHDAFCISVLDSESKGLLGHFARGFEPGQPAFEGVDIGTAGSGVPYLNGALAYLECKLVGDAVWSDHTIFCGEVVAGGVREGGGDPGEPMIHTRKTGQSY